MTLGGRGVGVFVAGLVAALVTALMAVLPVTGAQAAGDLVVWPDVDDINPKVTPYSITVNDTEGVSYLIARWNVPLPGSAAFGFREVLLPYQGTVSLPFDETFVKNGVTRVTIYRCNGEVWSWDCIELATGPLTRVWVEVETKFDYFTTVGTAPKAVPFTYSPAGTGITTWRILAADGSEVASGRSEGGQLMLAVPPGTPEQRGTLEVFSSVDETAVGHLDGHVTRAIDFDGVPPPAPRISLSDSIFYPHVDGYKDEVQVGMAGEGGDRTVVLRAEDQDTGASYLVEDFESGTIGLFYFDGRTDRGIRIPAGNYRLRMISSDEGGDSSALSQPIALHWERLVNRTFDQTVPAAKTVIKKYVGRCSTLRKPAMPGWSGSLGYYSGTRCRNAKHAYVQVIHGLYIPESVFGDYRDFRISLIGGPNRKEPESYVVLGYYNKDKKWKFEYREEFRGGGVHAHPGSVLRQGEADRFVHQDTNGSFVAWGTGLTSGSRYDVKSFRVHIRYQELVL